MKHAARACIWLFVFALIARADWKDDVGYTSLVARLGGTAPPVTTITVKQVEAPVVLGAPNDSSMWAYHPDPTIGDFSGKTINFLCSLCDNAVASGHATNVGDYFYGNAFSMSGGITMVDSDEADNWITNSLHATSNASSSSSPATESRRIENHSWITGDTTSSNNVAANDVCERMDLVMQRDGVLVMGGVNNNVTPMPKYPSSAYNLLTVGRSDGFSSVGPVVSYGGTPLLDGDGRVKPDIVAPQGETSWATPTIASAGALLLQVEDNLNVLSSLTTSQQKVGKAVLAKALLMAGATKAEFASLGGWRKGFATPSTNGTVPLDYRFGAGELNIDNSHRILTTHTQQLPSESALVTSTGWNYTSIVAGSPHHYFFEVSNGSYISSLSCLLTWNRHVTQSGHTLSPVVANLDLRLYEASGFTVGTQRDLSVSSIDNVEHIWLQNLTAGRYVLEVTAVSLPTIPASDPDPVWRYAIAWDAQTTPATLPPDLDHDGDVDADDFALFKACQSRSKVPPPGSCTAADFDGDNDVDMDDFARFQRCYSGKGVIAPSTCYTP